METEDYWKNSGAETQKFYYLAFGERLFDDYDFQNGLEYLRTKICFAMFGPPAEETDTVLKAYTAAQKSEAEKVKEKIFEIICDNRVEKKLVGMIFVYCYTADKKQFVVPIFRVKVSSKNEEYDTKYVTLDCQVYNSWEHWKRNNKFPPMQYCYPKNGYYSCVENGYKFDSDAAPCLEYDESPANTTKAKTIAIADTSTSVIGAASAAIGLASFAIPILPCVAVGGFIAGTAVSVYSSTKSACRLYNKNKYGESLTDRESLSHWVNLGIVPLNFFKCGLNSKFQEYAVNGVLCGDTFNKAVNAVNWSVLAFDFAAIGLSAVDLYKEPNYLAFLRCSISIFFFCHTLMEVKTAEIIYHEAQKEYCKQRFQNLSSEELQKTFKDIFLNDRTKVTKNGELVCGVERNATIIWSLNRIDDSIIAKLSDTASCDIKGKIDGNAIVTLNSWNGLQQNFNCEYNSPLKWIMLNPLSTWNLFSPENLCLHGSQIWKDIAVQEKINHLTEKSAIALGEFSNKDMLAAVIRATISGLGASAVLKKIGFFSNDGFDDYIGAFKEDMKRVSEFVKTHGITYVDKLYALLYYRKSREKFTSFMLKNSITFNIKATPQNYRSNYKLKSEINVKEQMFLKLYVNALNKLLVVIEENDVVLISYESLYTVNWQVFEEHMLSLHNDSDIPVMQDVLKSFAEKINIPSITIFVDLNGTAKLPIDDTMDESTLKNITWILAALTMSLKEIVQFGIFSTPLSAEHGSLLTTLELNESSSVSALKKGNEYYVVIETKNYKTIFVKLPNGIMWEAMVKKIQKLHQKDEKFLISDATKMLAANRKVTDVEISVINDTGVTESCFQMDDFYKKWIANILMSMTTVDISIEFVIDSVNMKYPDSEYLEMTEKLNDQSMLEVYIHEKTFTLIIKKPKHGNIIAVFTTKAEKDAFFERLLSSHNINSLPSAADAAKKMPEKFDSSEIMIYQKNEYLKFSEITMMDDYFDKKIAWILENIEKSY